MKWDALFKGDYIAAVEFGDKQPTLEIESVEGVSFETEDDKVEGKPVVKFRGQKRTWVVNKTNAACLKAMFGKDIENAVGKRITLQSKDVMAFGEMVPGIRIVGSPDLKAPIKVTVKHRKKRPETFTLQVTGKAVPSQTEPEPGPGAAA